MDSSCPFLIRRYSTFRNDLPFLVWHRYFTNASSAPVVSRSRSNFPMKSTCVSQHCFLKALLLMWSSPAALVKVKLSASMASNVPKSFFSHAPYHLRTISSFVKFCPPALALAGPGRLMAPTSAQAPVASRFLRDTAILVIVRSPFHDVLLSFSPDRDADRPSLQTGWYVDISPLVASDAIRLACGCPVGAWPRLKASGWRSLRWSALRLMFRATQLPNGAANIKLCKCQEANRHSTGGARCSSF